MPVLKSAAPLPIQLPAYDLGKQSRMAQSFETLHPRGRPEKAPISIDNSFIKFNMSELEIPGSAWKMEFGLVLGSAGKIQLEFLKTSVRVSWSRGSAAFWLTDHARPGR